MLRKLMSRLAKFWKALAVVVFSALLIWFVLQGYSLDWTGFGDFTNPNGEFVRGKTLWDWMELLVIPIFLGIGAFFLNRSERNSEHEIEADRQREIAYQSYIDQMATLFLREKLRTTRNKEVHNVATTRTFIVLRGLDGKRKGLLLGFLQMSKLIDKDKPIVKLVAADLSGAMLCNAPLYKVNLCYANLRDADLSGAYLCDALLVGADLSGASLHNANLMDANLRGAIVSNKQLATTFSLKNAEMPNGTIHE